MKLSLKSVSVAFMAVMLVAVMAFSVACSKNNKENDSLSLSSSSSSSALPAEAIAREDRSSYSANSFTSSMLGVTVGDLSSKQSFIDVVSDNLDGYLFGDIYSMVVDYANKQMVSNSNLGAVIGYSKRLDGKWRLNFDNTEAHYIVNNLFNTPIDGSQPFSITQNDLSVYGEKTLLDLLNYPSTIKEQVIKMKETTSAVSIIADTTIREWSDVLSTSESARLFALLSIIESFKISDFISEENTSAKSDFYISTLLTCAYEIDALGYHYIDLYKIYDFANNQSETYCLTTEIDVFGTKIVLNDALNMLTDFCLLNEFSKTQIEISGINAFIIDLVSSIIFELNDDITLYLSTVNDSLLIDYSQMTKEDIVVELAKAGEMTDSSIKSFILLANANASSKYGDMLLSGELTFGEVANRIESFISGDEAYQQQQKDQLKTFIEGLTERDAKNILIDIINNNKEQIQAVIDEILLENPDFSITTYQELIDLINLQTDQDSSDLGDSQGDNILQAEEKNLKTILSENTLTSLLAEYDLTIEQTGISRVDQLVTAVSGINLYDFIEGLTEQQMNNLKDKLSVITIEDLLTLNNKKELE